MWPRKQVTSMWMPTPCAMIRLPEVGAEEREDNYFSFNIDKLSANIP